MLGQWESACLQHISSCHISKKQAGKSYILTSLTKLGFTGVLEGPSRCSAILKAGAF